MQNVPARRLSSSWLAFGVSLAAGSAALGGCGANVAPIEVQFGCPEMPLRGPEAFASAPPETVIDDFEDGDARLTQVAGRNGSWVGVGSMGATTAFEASDRCVARGTHSGHLSSVATLTYQANFNAVMIDPFAEGNGFNAGAYSGFSFWIAMGETQKPPFETPIGVTTVDTVAGGNVCSAPGGVCGDYYAIRPEKRIPLTHTWTRHVVHFDELFQYGFGIPQVMPLNKNALVSIMIWPEPQFDIWLDDVRFEP
jgi:hypothetical protein